MGGWWDLVGDDNGDVRGSSAPHRPVAGRVPVRLRVGYAAGDLGVSIAYFAFGFFFLFYLTDLVGLAPSVAGTVVLIGKLWDGVNDPLIGMLCDRTRSQHGRKRVYLLYGAVPFGVSFVVLWMIPAGAPVGATVALAVGRPSVFRTVAIGFVRLLSGSGSADRGCVAGFGSRGRNAVVGYCSTARCTERRLSGRVRV